MKAKVKVSGGSHSASTNVSSQALRLRISVSTLWNALSAFSMRSSMAEEVRSLGGALSVWGMRLPVSAAAHNALVSTIRFRSWL